MVNILAFDTTMAACSVAVVTPQKTARLSQPMTRGHAERLMPMIEETMADAGLTFADLDRIAVTRGPGSFTGVRVGIAAARGLSLAANLPVTGVNTLQALAWSAPAAGLDLVPGAVAVALDARRGEVYFQLFSSLSAEMPPLGSPAALSPDAAAAELPSRTMMILGSGAEPVITASRKRDGLVPAMQTATADMTALAKQAAHIAQNDDPVHPLYLRASDAKPQDGKSLSRQT